MTGKHQQALEAQQKALAEGKHSIFVDADYLASHKPEDLKGSAERWRRLMYGEFEPNRELYEMAMEYHQRCDAFDVQLCGNPRGIPVNGHEIQVVNQHAKKVLRELEDRIVDEEMSFTSNDLRREIQRLAR